MHRTGSNLGFGVKLALYVAAGTAVATVSGALLALAGGYLSVDGRAAVASIAASVGLLLSLSAALGHRVPLLQRDRETPRGWLSAGAVSWALRNGAAIGFGANTRLGVWLWYVIPFGAFVSGNVLIGAAGYGAYGLVRTGGAGLILAVQNRYRDEPVWQRVLRQSGRARRVADMQLLVVCAVALLLLGV